MYININIIKCATFKNTTLITYYLVSQTPAFLSGKLQITLGNKQ